MAAKGKKKDKKANDKKNKRGDGASIAAGITPSAMLSAVPRSPPPPPATSGKTEVDLGLTAGTGVLSASILGKMFNSQDMEETVPTDTDTSLYDYEHAKDTFPYSGTGTWPSGGSRFNTGEHGTLPPPTGFDGDTEDEDPRQSYHEIETAIAPARYTPVSQGRSSPGGINDDVRPGSRSMQRFDQDDTKSMRMSGRSHRSDGGSRPGSRLEERLEMQMVNKQYISASPKENSLRSTLQNTKELSRASSMRMTTLERRDAEILQKQARLEQQVEQQMRLQDRIMRRLSEKGLINSGDIDPAASAEIGSIIQETQSITANTLDKQGELIQNFQERTAVLEKEKQELLELNEQIEEELNNLRRLALEGDHKEETITLKSTVHRLNQELSRYQAKFRRLSDTELDELPGLPMKGPKPSWLMNTRYLAPLFVAYDDRLNQADQVIRHYESELEDVRLKIEDIIKENQRLHLRVEQQDVMGPMSMTEWRQLQEQCKLVLEENQLLMEQLDVQQNKTKDMHRAHTQEVAHLSKRVVLLESEKTELESELTGIRDTVGDIKSRQQSTLIESRSKVTIENHMSSLTELKRNMEEERRKHSHEIQNVLTKMQTAVADRKSLQIQLEEFRRENRELKAEVKALNKAVRKSHRKVLLLKQAFEDATVKEHTAEHYLANVVKVAEQTAAERDSLAEAALKQKQERKAAMNKLAKGTLTVNKMQEKMKMYKAKASIKLDKAAHRMKEQDEDFDKQKYEFEREINHLRLLVREKEEVLNHIEGDKKNIEEDLETMWQVASQDNRRMRDTMKKSLHKLKEHEGLRTIIDKEDPDEFLKLGEEN